MPLCASSLLLIISYPNRPVSKSGRANAFDTGFCRASAPWRAVALAKVAACRQPTRLPYNFSLRNFDRFFQQRRNVDNRALVARVNDEQRLVKIDMFADFFNSGKADREIDRVVRFSTTGAE